MDDSSLFNGIPIYRSIPYTTGNPNAGHLKEYKQTDLKAVSVSDTETVPIHLTILELS